LSKSDWSADAYSRHARFVSELGAPVVALLDPQPGERILDVGCGDGVLTRELMERGCTAVGIDSSPSMVRAARERGVDARLLDAGSLAFVSCFDAVFSNAALHWMKDADAVINGVARALKPGGRFVAEMGGCGNVAALRRALREHLPRFGIDAVAIDPWYFPDVEEYAGRLRAGGFAVRWIGLLPRPTRLPTGVSGWITAIARPFLAPLSGVQRRQLLAAMERELAPVLSNNESELYADYVRLRFLAVKSPET
jgi:trans-aconitate methyltransferase